MSSANRTGSHLTAVSAFVKRVWMWSHEAGELARLPRLGCCNCNLGYRTGNVSQSQPSPVTGLIQNISYKSLDFYAKQIERQELWVEIAKLYIEDGHINVKFRRYEHLERNKQVRPAKRASSGFLGAYVHMKNVGASLMYNCKYQLNYPLFTVLQIALKVRFIHSAVWKDICTPPKTPPFAEPTKGFGYIWREKSLVDARKNRILLYRSYFVLCASIYGPSSEFSWSIVYSELWLD